MKSNSIHSIFLFQGISLILLVLMIPLEVVLSTPLTRSSSDFLISLQHARVPSLTSLFSIFHYINEALIFSFITPFILHFLDPIRVPRLIICITLTFYLSNILALLFQEYRPFWYNKKIKGELCLEGYGNPSSEIMITGTVLATFSIELFHSNKFRAVIYSLTAAVTLLITFAFVYLGENFPHQAINSLFISFILVTFTFTFDKKLITLANKSCYDYKKNRKSVVIWYLLCLFLIFVTLGIDILILSFSPETPKRINYAVTHCSSSYNPDGRSNLYRACSVLYVLAYVAGSLQLSKRMSVFWTVTNWWKRLIRYIINAGLCFGGFYICAFIPSKDSLSSTIFTIVLPEVIAALLTYFLLPLAFRKLKITNEVPIDLWKLDKKALYTKKRFAIN